jgi:hypothetical protein
MEKTKTVAAPKNNVRDNKIDLSLVPFAVVGEEMAQAYLEGVKKYTRESWRAGFAFSDMVAAIHRHLNGFWEKGEDYDPEAVEIGVYKTHIAGIMFSCTCLLYMLREGMTEFDNRPLKANEELAYDLNNLCPKNLKKEDDE